MTTTPLSAALCQQIVALLRREVIPAVGCTEPMAVALCVAKATELLRQRPTHLTALLSGNVMKNAMGVGIPATGMIGLPIAIALGVVVGKADYELSVLKDTTPAAVSEAQAYLAATTIDIRTKEPCPDNLYIEITATADNHSATAIIATTHTRFVFLCRDDSVLKDERSTIGTGNSDDSAAAVPLTLHTVYDFATTVPLADVRFILDARDLNLAAARESRKGNYGHCLGKTIDRPLAHGIFGNSIFSHIIAQTAAACDARMGGALIPVMCNSGSGNQGICATNPVAVFANENENTEEETIRALVLSHLTAIYVHQSLGTLSALCGCVVAALGASVAITYLMGGDYDRVCCAVKNMIANLTGMLCDGAKPACALKLTSAVSTALLSALLAIEGRSVTAQEGIIDDDVDQSIHNLTSIGGSAMALTDKKILEIMSSKRHC